MQNYETRMYYFTSASSECYSYPQLPEFLVGLRGGLNLQAWDLNRMVQWRWGSRSKQCFRLFAKIMQKYWTRISWFYSKKSFILQCGVNSLPLSRFKTNLECIGLYQISIKTNTAGTYLWKTLTLLSLIHNDLLRPPSLCYPVQLTPLVD